MVQTSARELENLPCLTAEVRSSGMSLAHAPDQMRAEKDLVIEVQPAGSNWWTKGSWEGMEVSMCMVFFGDFQMKNYITILKSPWWRISWKSFCHSKSIQWYWSDQVFAFKKKSRVKKDFFFGLICVARCFMAESIPLIQRAVLLSGGETKWHGVAVRRWGEEVDAV